MKFKYCKKKIRAMQAFTIKDQPEWAYIQVTAPNGEEKVPIHLCCVIDTSYSMNEQNKLKNVKRSIQFLLDFLGPNDRISVITFSTYAKTVLSTFATTAEKESINVRMSFIEPEESTNLSGGILEAHRSLLENTVNMKQGMIILTDGHTNVGIIEPHLIVELVKSTVTRFNGTSISCIGYGHEHNASLLQKISTNGSGAYYIVNNIEEVAAVFGDILGGWMSCAYQQLEVILPEGAEVMTRYPTQNNRVLIGDLATGMDAVVIAKIPTGTQIQFTAYELKKKEWINRSVITEVVQNTDAQINATAHYMRFEVLNILEDLKKDGNVVEKVKVIDRYIVQITEYCEKHVHALWAILLEKLEQYKVYLKSDSAYRQKWDNILTQQGECLGLLRGMSSDDSSLPIPNQASQPFQFSNGLQREFSDRLVAASQDVDEKAEAPMQVYTQEDIPEDIPEDISDCNTLQPSFKDVNRVTSPLFSKAVLYSQFSSSQLAPSTQRVSLIQFSAASQISATSSKFALSQSYSSFKESLSNSIFTPLTHTQTNA